MKILRGLDKLLCSGQEVLEPGSQLPLKQKNPTLSENLSMVVCKVKSFVLKKMVLSMCPLISDQCHYPPPPPPPPPCKPLRKDHADILTQANICLSSLTVNPLLSPPGGLFFFQAPLSWGGGLIERGINRGFIVFMIIISCQLSIVQYQN